MINILTFDIEDWFHINFQKEFNDEIRWKDYPSRIEANTDVILEILDSQKIKATFFCLGWVARNYPHIIKSIQKSGHDIGSHSDIHNLSSSLNKNDFEIDLKISIQSIEEIIGTKIEMFRAPAFSIGKSNLWAIEILIKHGIKFDCSILPAVHQFGGFPELKVGSPFFFNHQNSMIKEFPVSTSNFFGRQMLITGGGYFRFYPYPVIRRHIANSNYVITYFHPRDFDANQPYLEDIPISRKFKSYVGLKGSLKKFNRMISEFKFVSVSQADKLIDWDNAIIINL